MNYQLFLRWLSTVSIILLFFLNLFSQSETSFENLIKKDSFDIYMEKAKNFQFSENPDSIINYIDKALLHYKDADTLYRWSGHSAKAMAMIEMEIYSEAEESAKKALAAIPNIEAEIQEDLEYELAEIQAVHYYMLGYTQFYQYKYLDAIENFEKCLSFGEKSEKIGLGDDKNINVLLGRSLYFEGFYAESEMYLKKAINNVISEYDKYAIAKAKKYLGNVYKAQNHYDKAIALYKEANVVFKKEKEEWDVAAIYLSLASAYNDKGEWKKSLFHFNQALDTARIYQEWGIIYSVHRDLGLAYYSRNNNKDAINHLDSALYYSRKIKYTVEELDLMTKISRSHLRDGNTNLALQIINNSESLIEDEVNVTNKVFALQTIARIESSKGNYKRAFNKLKEAFILRGDYIDNVELKATNRSSRVVIEKEKASKQADAFQKDFLEIENKIQKTSSENLILNYWSGILAVLVFFILLLFYFYKNRTDSEMEKFEIVKKEISSPYYQAQKKIELNGKEKTKLRYSDIIYIKREKDVIKYYMNNGKSHIEYRRSLDQLEELVPLTIFFRSHQSYLVNILNVHKEFSGERKLEMDNGDIIPVSSRKKVETFRLLRKLAELHQE